MFKKATREKAKLRLALNGPSKTGKTYSALAIASGLGERVAVIDSERGRALLYADLFEFDHVELEDHHPANYMKAIFAADQMGYDVLVIDSFSHAWCGKNGALELVDKIAKKMQNPNTFSAWRDVTPVHNSLIDAVLGCKAHVICTMRVKTVYSMDKNDRGKVEPRKVGLEPIQRDGVDYEFDIFATMTHKHEMIISNETRFPELDGELIEKPGPEFGQRLAQVLAQGKPRVRLLGGPVNFDTGAGLAEPMQLTPADVEPPLEDPDTLIGEDGYNAMLTELGKKHDDVYNWFIKHHPEAKGKRIIDFFTVADRAVLRSKVK